MDVSMRMLDLGTVDSTVTILRWLAEVGQLVRRGQPVLEVETDKSIMELESSVTGTLRSIAVPAGAEAATGQILASFAVENESRVEVASASTPVNVVSVAAGESDLSRLRPGAGATIVA